MDATAWVAVAGIIGTLLAPLVAAWVQHRHARAERLLEERLDVYSKLLAVVGQLVDDAQTWSSIPIGELEVPVEQANRMLARVRVVASDDVYEAVMTWKDDLEELQRRLLEARKKEQRVSEEGGPVRATEALESRLSAGEIADQIRGHYRRLEKLVRSETAR